MRRCLVAATAAASLFVFAAPAHAVPPAPAPGCVQFVANAGLLILNGPALYAFSKHGYESGFGGIGPCWAPHPGGRG